ncbi:ZIP family metal transporter [Brevibacterium daeguense]|nr:zinc permease [Brevibacterium daeguense]
MLTAVLFGVIASSPLVIGAFIGARFELPKRVLAILLSFAAGALITALSFELFAHAHDRAGLVPAIIGLLAGALAFTILSALLDRAAQPEGREEAAHDYPGSAKLDLDAAASDRSASSASVRGTAGLALLAAVTLDGAPENIALGVSLTEGTGGIALLAAIFASNLPESIVGASSMREQGRSTAWTITVWTVCAVVLVLAVMLGAGPLAASSPAVISIPLAVAAGAVIASLADTLMPEAYETGGPAVALSTSAGFVTAYALSLA